jgi:hypothetical protein
MVSPVAGHEGPPGLALWHHLRNAQHMPGEHDALVAMELKRQRTVAAVLDGEHDDAPVASAGRA